MALFDPTKSTLRDFSSTNNINVPGASTLYNTFLTSGAIIPPPGVLQISGFGFDDEQNDDVDLSNEITDHWVEDNVAVQDHIGVAPVKICLIGRVSELTFSKTSVGAISSALSSVENGLSQVNSYLGKYTPGVTDKLLTTITQAQNIAVQIEQGAARIAQIASYFNIAFGGAVRNKQQQSFALLSALRNARILFTVNTPFQVYFNMAIENIRARQPSKTKTVSEFTVSMKQIQFVNNVDLSSFLTQYGGRAAYGYQPVVGNGTAVGVAAAATAVAGFF